MYFLIFLHGRNILVVAQFRSVHSRNLHSESLNQGILVFDLTAH